MEIGKENLLALEALPFPTHTNTTVEKQEPLATLTMPYHPCIEKLKRRLTEMGIRLAFSTNGSLRQQLRRKSKTKEQPKGSVYVINCTICPKVYIGQTGKQVEQRVGEHSRGTGTDIMGAVTGHNLIPGHVMDLENPSCIYRSDCKSTRITVEAALIHVAPTIQNNTASSIVEGSNLVAPLICKATRLNWKKLADSIPSLKEEAIPWHRKHLFGNSIVRAPEPLRSQAAPPGPASFTRSRTRLSS